MIAVKLLRAGTVGLGPVLGLSVGTLSPQQHRFLHTTSLLSRRDAPSLGTRSNLRASSTPSASDRQTGASPSRTKSSQSGSAASTPVAKTPNADFSTPSRAASSSIPARHHQSKVEVVPFRVPSKAAKEYLTTLAKIEIMPRVMSKWSIIKHQLLSLIGLKSVSSTNDDDIVKLRRMTALYLPVWIVDASFEMKCRGNDGRADSNFIITSARFPGHSWKPMDSLPMIPPPPYDMIPTKELQKDPNYAGEAPKEAWNNLGLVDYIPYESHLKSKNDLKVKIDGGIPDPLPFTISPLFLPNMLRTQLELKDLTFAPDLAAGFQLPGADKHGLGLTIALVNEAGEQIKTPPVRFEPDTLKLDMMAAYPILMPLHLAEFSYKDQDDRKQFITMVLGAWDSNGLQFCMKEKDEDWRWSFSEHFKIDKLDLYPRAPIKTSLSEMFERQREKERAEEREKLAQEPEEADGEEGEGKSKIGSITRKELEAKWAKEDEEHTKTFRADLRSKMMEKLSSELSIKAAVEERCVDLVKRADWLLWERDEREAFQMRTSWSEPDTDTMTAAEKERHEATLTTARTAPTEPRPFQWLSQEADRKAETEHPDRKAGLGRYIHWTSPHVQRLSHNVYANRRYLTEAIPDVLLSRKRMASIAETGHDVDRSHIKAKLGDGTKLSGEEAWKTIASDDINIRQQRESLKPRWLKALLEASQRR